MKKVLVTGASGFVGSALVPILLKSGFSVRCAVRSFQLINLDTVEYVEIGDINDKTDWSLALKDVDAVVHLAARVHQTDKKAGADIEAFRSVNVQGTKSLAKSAIAAGVNQFVFLSSIKVNGESGTFSETSKPDPKDAYGISKLEAEEILTDIFRGKDKSLVIIRPPLIYGPGVKANLNALIRLVRTGVPLPFGSFKNKRSLIGIGNLVDLLISCLRKAPEGSHVYLVSDGKAVSTLHLVEAIAKADHRRTINIPIPMPLISLVAIMLGKSEMMQKLGGDLVIDSDKLSTELGWIPPFSFQESISRMIARDNEK
ncbi:NAD-dependent epimerase/dehydratase family protein [bacterium]|nr:NAD-dependent epimerase/dehydratase family protein [bacterium]